MLLSNLQDAADYKYWFIEKDIGQVVKMKRFYHWAIAKSAWVDPRELVMSVVCIPATS